MNTSSHRHKTSRDAISAEALDRYLAGSCSLEEQAQIASWIAEFANGETGIAMLRAMDGTPTASVDIDLHWQALTNQIRSTGAASLPDQTDRLVSNDASDGRRTFPVTQPGEELSSVSAGVWQGAHITRLTWWRAAFFPICAVVLLTVGWITATHRFSNKLARQTSTYTTGNGERARITLPDGSQVVLNVASQLEVPSNFAAGSRTISLKGEALFTVAHSSGQPFVVKTTTTSTRVLGTRFIVREYATDTTALVVVENGKVAMGGLILSANQELAIYNGVPEAIRVADHRRFGFARGTLILEGVALKDAIPDLNRWFNARVQLGDPSLAERILSGDCTTGSVANLAELLELTFDIKVVRKGNILTLYSKDS